MQVETLEAFPFVRIVRGVATISALTAEEYALVRRWALDESRVVLFKGMTNRDDGADELAFAKTFPHSEEWAPGAVGRLGNVDSEGQLIE